MKSIKPIILTTLAIFTMIFMATPVMAQPKIATADSQQILENLPEAKSIMDQLQALSQQAESDFATKVSAFQQDIDSYESKKAMMTPDAQKNTENNLQQRQVQLQQERQQRAQELQQRQVELLQPLQQRVLDAIEAIAAKEGFVAVFDKSPTISNIVLYSDDSIDITFKVLDYLKTNKKTTKSTK